MKRHGFTLVELLVVIGIIALLCAIMTSASVHVYTAAARVGNANDINQLSAACQSFKLKYGFYPPSRFDMSTPPNSESQYIAATMYPGSPKWSTLNWGRFGAPVQGVLQGDQCLVFFLGGVQGQVNGVNVCYGWSNTTTDPTDVQPGTPTTIFYQFKSNRLTYTRTPTLANQSFSYLDNWKKGMPYAYLSAHERENGYIASDCDLVPVNPIPVGNTIPPTYANAYLTANGNVPQYWNQLSFQIISAGQDGIFGYGRVYPSQLAPPGDPGQDDQSNFATAQLGSPSR